VLPSANKNSTKEEGRKDKEDRERRKQSREGETFEAEGTRGRNVRPAPEKGKAFGKKMTRKKSPKARKRSKEAKPAEVASDDNSGGTRSFSQGINHFRARKKRSSRKGRGKEEREKRREVGGPIPMIAASCGAK